MRITQPHHIIHVRLMLFRIQRIAQKNHKVYLIVLNLRSNLLLAPQMSRQALVYVQIRYLLYQSSRGTCGIQIILA